MPKKISKIDEVLKNQKNILKKISRIEKEEKEELEKEENIELEEAKEFNELEKIEDMEKNLEKELKIKPLKKITYKDFYKSVIGAFFGILGHFSFFYGVEIAHNITVLRASALYVIAFIIGLIFLYMTGFRKVEKNPAWHILPLRLFIIYFTSIVVVIIVLFVFDFISLATPFIETYKIVATISILAVMGAVAADLIGKNE